MSYYCPESALEILLEIREEILDEVIYGAFPHRRAYQEFVDRLKDITLTMRSPTELDVVRWLRVRVEQLAGLADYVQQDDHRHAAAIKKHGLRRVRLALAEVTAMRRPKVAC
jgi:hypothetical protein